MDPRSTSIGFVKRTRKNLEIIEREFAKDGKEGDAHVVTQLVNSLLGLIVFPFEESFYKGIEGQRLSELEAQGWPALDIFLDKPIAPKQSKLEQHPPKAQPAKTKRGTRKTETLDDLLWHLRNGVGHARVIYSSDSRDITGVLLEIRDAPTAEADPNWGLRIRGDQLRSLCEKLIEAVDGYLG